MPRHLPAVVAVTGLSSLACGASGLLPTTPMPEGLAPHTAPLPTDPVSGFQPARTLNAHHDEHGTIYVDHQQPAHCFVHLPFDEPLSSWQPPEQQLVDCPPEMHDAAWLECRGGTISVDASGERCACTVDGNPPPPPRWVHCPA